MALQSPPVWIKLLADDLRWTLVSALAGGDHRVQELVEQVGQPMNLVSYHLKKLRTDGVVTTRRSEADARDVYYSLELDRLQELYRAAGRALHPALTDTPALAAMPDQPVRVLFVCTHNSARSQMAEGLLRQMAEGQVEVYSAGSQPQPIHPEAVRTMEALGVDLRGQRPKHLDEVAGIVFDYVITVCDRARETCPVFPGQGQPLHWGFYDPAAIADASERERAFKDIARRLQTRMGYFLAELAAKQGDRPSSAQPGL